MGAIIVEGVLFVALLATGGALLYWLLLTFTPAGVRLRQTQNRKRIDRKAELVCSIHGLRTEDQLVRLANGELVCPDCYKETFHD
ncbi:MAG: hypothetical protein JWL61_1657 [Gemmatimonadetes bacterium]|jgi:hypothetical protein|nr:hypothetical protein [Gemmatimonadota bacterium]